jgi:YHS domain-containing protein
LKRGTIEILGSSTARRDVVMARDPVCGLRLDDAKSAKGIADEVAYTSEYEGLTYYFCSRRCK